MAARDAKLQARFFHTIHRCQFRVERILQGCQESGCNSRCSFVGSLSQHVAVFLALTGVSSLCCSHLQHRVAEADVGAEQLRLLARVQRRAHHSRAHPELLQQGFLLPEQLSRHRRPPAPPRRRNSQIDRQAGRGDGETGRCTQGCSNWMFVIWVRCGGVGGVNEGQ